MLRLRALILLASLVPFGVSAQTADAPSPSLALELNTLADAGQSCRLTFVVTNLTGTDIDEAVFETVVFGTDGSVATLSLFDFRALPSDRPRVRQFDLPGMTCDSVGRTLINGASSCVVNGAQNDICQSALSLSSRVNVELLG